MATSYSVLLPEVLPECPNVPDILAINAIRNAVRNFCEESTAWRVKLPLISAVTGESGTGEYTLTLPAGTQVVSVMPILHQNGLPVYHKTIVWLDNYRSNWRTMTGAQANYFASVAADIIRLIPYPVVAVADSIQVSAALKPTPTSIDFDDWVYEEHFETITSLAKSSLMIMPGVAWSNPELGMFYKTKADEGIQDALSKITSGFMKGKVDRGNKVRGHFF